MRIRIAAATLAFIAGDAMAADWNVAPRVILQFETDDNNRLTHVPGQEVSVAGGLLDAQVEFSAATPRSRFNLTPRVRASAYPDDEDEDRTDGFLGMDWRFTGQRSIAALAMDYSQRTILGRYLGDDAPDPDDGGLGEPDPGTGSGRATDPTDRNEFKIRPSAGFALSERTQMLLGLGYQDVEFDDEVENDRVNFTNADASLGFRFLTAPTTSVTVLGGVRRYEPEDRPEADVQYANVEWSREVSEVSKVYVRGGANRVKNDVAGADWETGFNGGAGVQWTFQVTELFVELNRYIDPSSSGQVVNRDQLRFQVARRFSERARLKFSARAIRDGKIRGEEMLERREYFAGSVEYEWRFSRPLSLTAGYQYTWREYEDDPTDAESNRFFAGIRYEPRRR